MFVPEVPTVNPSTTTVPADVVSVAQIAVAALVDVAELIVLKVSTPPEAAGAAVADSARSAMIVPEHATAPPPVGYMRSLPDVPVADVIASIRVFFSAVL